MDPVSILADVQLAITLAKMAVSLGVDVAPFVKNAYDIAFNSKTLTDSERQAMQDQEVAFRARIDAVIAADDAATD